MRASIIASETGCEGAGATDPNGLSLAYFLQYENQQKIGQFWNAGSRLNAFDWLRTLAS